MTSGNDLQELLSVDDCESDTCDLSLRQLRGNLTSQAFEILGMKFDLGDIARYCEVSGHAYIYIYIHIFYSDIRYIIKHSNGIYHYIIYNTRVYFII